LSATGARYTGIVSTAREFTRRRQIDEAAEEVRQKCGGGMECWHKENPGGTRTSLRVLLNTVS
jgi:hypothetical protein